MCVRVYMHIHICAAIEAFMCDIVRACCDLRIIQSRCTHAGHHVHL